MQKRQGSALYVWLCVVRRESGTRDTMLLRWSRDVVAIEQRAQSEGERNMKPGAQSRCMATVIAEPRC